MVLWYHLCDMWAHFVVYIWTRWCKCHVQGHVRLGVGHSGRGSGIFGWWWAAYKISLHIWVDSLSQIPLYAGIKIWNNFISPMVLGRSPAAARTEEPNEKEALSKRQEKLRKKSERGDPRIKVGKRWICASVGAPCVEMHHILRPRFNNQLSAVMGTVDSLSRTHDLQWLKPREQLQAERVYAKSRKPFWFDRQPRRLIVPLGESRLLLFYCGKVYGIIYTSRTTSSTHKDLACLDICTNGDGLLQCTQLSGPNQAEAISLHLFVWHNIPPINHLVRAVHLPALTYSVEELHDYSSSCAELWSMRNAQAHVWIHLNPHFPVPLLQYLPLFWFKVYSIYIGSLHGISATSNLKYSYLWQYECLLGPRGHCHKAAPHHYVISPSRMFLHPFHATYIPLTSQNSDISPNSN